MWSGETDGTTACCSFLEAWWCKAPADEAGWFWIVFLLSVLLVCPGSALAKGPEASEEHTDNPGRPCPFLSRLADLVDDLIVLWLPLDAADECVISTGLAPKVPVSFPGLGILDSFLEGSELVRTRRAFSRAFSSSSMSSLSHGETPVYENSNMQTCGYYLAREKKCK